MQPSSTVSASGLAGDALATTASPAVRTRVASAYAATTGPSSSAMMTEEAGANGARGRPMSQTFTDSIGSLLASLAMAAARKAGEHAGIMNLAEAAAGYTASGAQAIVWGGSSSAANQPNTVTDLVHPKSAFVALRSREIGGTRASFRRGIRSRNSTASPYTYPKTLSITNIPNGHQSPNPNQSSVVSLIANSVYFMISPQRTPASPSPAPSLTVNRSPSPSPSVEFEESLGPNLPEDTAHPFIRLAARRTPRTLWSDPSPPANPALELFLRDASAALPIASDHSGARGRSSLGDDEDSDMEWDGDSHEEGEDGDGDLDMADASDQQHSARRGFSRTATTYPTRFPRELDMEGLDKAFAVCWIGEGMLLVATKCSTLALYNLTTGRRTILPPLCFPSDPYEDPSLPITDYTTDVLNPGSIRRGHCPVPPMARVWVREGMLGDRDARSRPSSWAAPEPTPAPNTLPVPPPIFRHDSGFGEARAVPPTTTPVDRQRSSLIPASVSTSSDSASPEASTPGASAAGTWAPARHDSPSATPVTDSAPPPLPVPPVLGPCPGIHHLAPNPSHTLVLVCGAPPHPLFVLSLPSLEPIAALSGLRDAAFSAAWLGNRMCVAAGRCGALGMWDLDDVLEAPGGWMGPWLETPSGPVPIVAPREARLKAHGGSKVRGVSVAQGLGEAVSVGGGGTVRVWDIERSGGLEHKGWIDLGGSGIEPVPLTSHSPHLHLLGTQRHMHLLDTRLSNPAMTVIGPDGPWGVRSVGVPYSGSPLVAVGGGGGGIGVVELRTGEYVRVGGGRDGGRVISTPLPKGGGLGIPHAALCVAWGGGGGGQGGWGGVGVRGDALGVGVGGFAVGGGPLQVCAGGGWVGVW
ncbi:hypothetical protein M427DRAFT_152473 [Gonapodya prolifera JEL478]|uniref:DDB1- and CUL4-associated factor 12 beta-propeller domain-containing protein n=1 Tax=Gonapodya prolifera (strain JEL478) TaxID=1344416 RepID=A0A139ASJ9_GONPJ|nr:hypothetical protein M427DRAFT_152473 [Gonapodya prolifera JEL478]|eukprot:KXS19455.1 hypothetical protein M427DRAFT_152473 [Gonapodya prolifera JEL478]